MPGERDPSRIIWGSPPDFGDPESPGVWFLARLLEVRSVCAAGCVAHALTGLYMGERRKRVAAAVPCARDAGPASPGGCCARRAHDLEGMAAPRQAKDADAAMRERGGGGSAPSSGVLEVRGSCSGHAPECSVLATAVLQARDIQGK